MKRGAGEFVCWVLVFGLALVQGASWDFNRTVLQNLQQKDIRVYGQGMNQDNKWTAAEIAELQKRVFYSSPGVLCILCPTTDGDVFKQGHSRRVELVYLASWKGDGLKDGQVLTVDYHVTLNNTQQEGALLQMNSHISKAKNQAQSLLMLRISKGQVTLRGWAVNQWKNVGTDHHLAPWPKDKRMEFHFEVKMTTKADGYIRMWVNGQSLFSLTGPTRDNQYPGGLQAGAYGKAVDRVFVHKMVYSVQ